MLEAFLKGEGPSKIFFYYQVLDTIQQEELKDTGAVESTLFLTYGDKEKLKDKAVYFFRNLPPYAKKKPIALNEPSDNDVLWGEITLNTIPHLNHMMEYLYNPFIELLKVEDWGATEQEQVKEYIDHTDKFAKEVKEAIGLMSPGQELFKLD